VTLTHDKGVLGCTTLVKPNPKLGVPKLGYMYPYASRGASAYLEAYI